MHSYRNGNRVSSTNGIEPPGQLRERNDLQKEVLVALFNAPERSNELVGRTTNAAKRSAASWRLVDGPPMDFLVDHKKTVTYLQRDHEDGMHYVFWELDALSILYGACRRSRTFRNRRFKH